MILSTIFMMTTIFILGDDSSSSEVHLGRMLQILREFSTDPILSIYVIDDVWEYMKAMKVCFYDSYCRLWVGWVGE